MKRVAVILGTRPEAIKLAPVIRTLRQAPGLSAEVCLTAQHRELVDEVLEQFDIVPDVDLALMAHDQSPAEIAGRAVTGLARHFADRRPDLVLVQGDTTTTLSGALAAYYSRLPVGHVEAGLRTGNLLAPWPEEGNRVLVSHLAAAHFAPTEANRALLRAEGVADETIFVTGNTIIDAVRLMAANVKAAPPHLPPELDEEIHSPDLRLVLITSHRRENFGTGLQNTSQAVRQLAREFPDVVFVWVSHPNPQVQTVLGELAREAGVGNMVIVPPQPYPSFVSLMSHAELILSDSGGVQEEASALGLQVLVLRDVTERPEAVSDGTVTMVGTDTGNIVRQARQILTAPRRSVSETDRPTPFGDGHAAERIVSICRDLLLDHGSP